MRMKTKALAVVLLVLGAIQTGCGITAPPAMTKSFPEGDPRALEDAGADPGKDSPDAPVRRITVPKDKEDDKGLHLAVEPQAQHFVAGKPLLVSLSVKNNNGTPSTIPYTSDQIFDIIIFADPDQRIPVFLWSENRMFTQNMSQQILGSGSTLKRVLDVPTSRDMVTGQIRKGDLSSPLTPGNYWLYAEHLGVPFLAAGPVQIEIVP
ncbi:hypothetical protein BH09SUM1_BH09SUM1_25800 [soil metagenome]